jgi:hypothetical protein
VSVAVQDVVKPDPSHCSTGHAHPAQAIADIADISDRLEAMTEADYRSLSLVIEQSTSGPTLPLRRIAVR